MIELEEVSFKYDDTDHFALSGVSLRAGAGTFVCVAGADCSGKSTLFRLLNGTAPRAFPGERSGTISVGGFDPGEQGHSAIGEIVTSVFDDPDSQIISLTVEEEVAFALVQRGFGFDEIAIRVDEALARVGLAGFNHRSTGSLSGGQKQRLVTASALALRPKVLLVDEGTSALDPEGARRFFSLIREMTDADGTTAVVNERDLDLMFEFADEMIVLDRGRVVLSGTPSEVAQEHDALAKLGLRIPAWLSLAAELKKRGLCDGPIPASERETAELVGRLVGRLVGTRGLVGTRAEKTQADCESAECLLEAARAKAEALA